MTSKAIPFSKRDQAQAEARGLERNYVHELVQSRRWAWMVAIGASGLCVLSIGAVAAMQPLKRVEKEVVFVNQTTGETAASTKLADFKPRMSEAVDKYWLNQYVLSRESYDWSTLAMNYRTTALLSAPEVQRSYFAIYEGKERRDKAWGAGVRLNVNVKSITLGPNAAVVRFGTDKETSLGVEHQDWIANIGYAYVDAEMTEGDRRLNPLGFQVTSYRVDPEIVGTQ